MKKLLILLLIIFTIDSFASGIGNVSSAPCDNDTLAKYTGTANVEINWEPNTINLNWYNGDEKLTVANNSQSCIYDGTLTVPTQPTKPGYTFNGWKVIRVPGGFTELEYLEATGTQCINTGIITSSDNVTYEWNAKDNRMSNGTLFGAQSDKFDNGGYSGLLYGTNTNTRLYIGFSSFDYPDYNSSDGNFHTWSMVISANNTVYLIKDGVSLSSSSWSKTLYRAYPIKLFCSSRDDVRINEFSSVAFKYFRVIDNGNTVFNGIPARRDSDGVLGMYDSISGQFFTNVGTGTFVAGPVVQ